AGRGAQKGRRPRQGRGGVPAAQRRALGAADQGQGAGEGLAEPGSLRRRGESRTQEASAGRGGEAGGHAAGLREDQGAARGSRRRNRPQGRSVDGPGAAAHLREEPVESRPGAGPGAALRDDGRDQRAPQPPHATLGFYEILLDEKANKTTPAERREFVAHINESGKRLVEHIRELIEFAQQEAGIQERPVQMMPPVGGGSKPPVILVADND